jgi:hypothetical protein
VYAAYLYDAVMLYAKAAHKLIESGGEITNGTAIIHSLLNQTYESKHKSTVGVFIILRILNLALILSFNSILRA